MAGLIGKDDLREMDRSFRARLTGTVGVLLFTSGSGGPYCAQARQLLEEVASLSEKIRLEVLDVGEARERAVGLAVEETPTIVVVAANGANLYYVGVPAGHQLRCLVEDVIDASRGRAEIDGEARRIIGRVDRETVIRVFVTPFCPYSPRVVRAAHRFALENPRIRALMVESLEFPELAARYGVVGVPRTVINEGPGFDGAPSEREFAERVLRASIDGSR